MEILWLVTNGLAEVGVLAAYAVSPTLRRNTKQLFIDGRDFAEDRLPVWPLRKLKRRKKTLEQLMSELRVSQGVSANRVRMGSSSCQALSDERAKLESTLSSYSERLRAGELGYSKAGFDAEALKLVKADRELAAKQRELNESEAEDALTAKQLVVLQEQRDHLAEMIALRERKALAARSSKTALEVVRLSRELKSAGVGAEAGVDFRRDAHRRERMLEEESAQSRGNSPSYERRLAEIQRDHGLLPLTQDGQLSTPRRLE